ncbi:MAG TPA: lipoprotein signal peptidase [Thiothrix sp.]|nr:lipoprotein signal peptidase [Thiothrix sp.]
MLRWVWLSLVVIFLDQLTKWMAVAWLPGLGIPVPILPHLNFTLAHNYGAAFSFLGDAGGWQRWFFTSLATMVSAYLLYWLHKLTEKEVWMAIGLALVLGGAVGNLLDRVLNGPVIDFIDFYFSEGGYHFATFNIADVAISIGAALLVILSLFTKDESAEEQASATLSQRAK